MSLVKLGAAGYLVDLDGTLITGRTVLPDARWLLDAIGDRFMLVSNNSEHTPNQLARQLQRLGLPIGAERIVLAGTTALDIIARQFPRARLQLLGSMALHGYARRHDLRVNEPAPEIVLVARDRRFNYARLAAATEAVSRGAQLFVACPDHSHPGAHGQPVPEAGALAAAVIAASGVSRHRVIGKPEPILFEIACQRLGIAPRDAVMIGDNIETDGAGARRLGMGYVEVRGGDIRSRFLEPISAVG